VPRIATNLSVAARDANVDNPLTILGLKTAETREQVREAYLSRIRLYHSDRYGGIDLPREVQEHISEMAKRINAAYRDALELCERRAPADAR